MHPRAGSCGVFLGKSRMSTTAFSAAQILNSLVQIDSLSSRMQKGHQSLPKKHARTGRFDSLACFRASSYDTCHGSAFGPS